MKKRLQKKLVSRSDRVKRSKDLRRVGSHRRWSISGKILLDLEDRKTGKYGPTGFKPSEQDIKVAIGDDYALFRAVWQEKIEEDKRRAERVAKSLARRAS